MPRVAEKIDALAEPEAKRNRDTYGMKQAGIRPRKQDSDLGRRLGLRVLETSGAQEVATRSETGGAYLGGRNLWMLIALDEQREHRLTFKKDVFRQGHREYQPQSRHRRESSTAKKTPTSNDSLIGSKLPAGEDKGNEVRAPAPSSYIYSYSAPHIGNSKCSFLALPIEIRLQIYDILLISRTDNQKQAIIFTSYRWAHFEILQTCRQIYDEGNSILYSQNEFRFYYVDSKLEFIQQIGPVNFGSIRSLHIRVDNISKQSAFLGHFNILAEEENGVRVMEYTGNSGRVSGTGDKLDFIRTLQKTKEIRQGWEDPYIYLQDGRYRLSSIGKFPFLELCKCTIAKMGLRDRGKSR
jgi:hypothetical protein